jgi:flagellar hook assembly protein FlgD
MKVYNMLGQKVKTLINQNQEAGYYSVEWDGRNNFGNPVSSGIYLYRIKAGNFISVHKMTLLR